MATTQTRPYLANADIKLEYGVAQTFALKYVTGKNCGEAKFPPFGPRVMFTSIDERKLWLGAEDASDFEHALLELGIQPADFIRVTKIKHPRGGGHSIRVERVDDAGDTRDNARDNAPAWVRDAAPSRIEAQLEKSIEMARERGAAAFQRAPARISPEPPPAPAHGNNGYSADHTPKPTAAHQLMGAFCAAIDAAAEAQAYAARKGLQITFTSEDIRAVAISAFIALEKAATGARY